MSYSSMMITTSNKDKMSLPAVQSHLVAALEQVSKKEQPVKKERMLLFADESGRYKRTAMRESAERHRLRDLSNRLNCVISGLETSVDKVIKRHENDLQAEHRKQVDKLTLELTQLKDAAEEINGDQRYDALETTILGLRKEVIQMHGMVQKKNDVIASREKEIRRLERELTEKCNHCKHQYERNRLINGSKCSSALTSIKDSITCSTGKQSSLAGDSTRRDLSSLSHDHPRGFQSIQHSSISPLANRNLTSTRSIDIEVFKTDLTLPTKQLHQLEKENPEFGSAVARCIEKCFTIDKIEPIVVNLFFEISRLCKDIQDRGQKLYKQMKDKWEKSAKEQAKISAQFSDLEAIFVECIKAAKSTQQSQNVSTNLPTNTNNNANNTSIDLVDCDPEKMISPEEVKLLFSEKDKLNVLERLLSHDKLLGFMQEKLFHNESSSAKNYLEQQSTTPSNQQIDDRISSDNSTNAVDPPLPPIQLDQHRKKSKIQYFDNSHRQHLSISKMRVNSQDSYKIPTHQLPSSSKEIYPIEKKRLSVVVVGSSSHHQNSLRTPQPSSLASATKSVDELIQKQRTESVGAYDIQPDSKKQKRRG